MALYLRYIFRGNTHYYYTPAKDAVIARAYLNELRCSTVDNANIYIESVNRCLISQIIKKGLMVAHVQAEAEVSLYDEKI